MKSVTRMLPQHVTQPFTTPMMRTSEGSV
jgi:hypothetical protein